MTTPRHGNEIPLVRKGSSSTIAERQPLVSKVPLTKKSFFGLVVGAALLGLFCITASLVGLYIWLQADYFHDPGPYAQNSWCGYDGRTFGGLVAFTLFPTVGFTLMYVALEVALRCTRGFNTLVGILFIFFACFCMSMGAIGMVWGNETMKCFGVFCVNMNTYVEIPNARPEAGIGFLAIVGIAAFASLIPVGLVMLLIAFRRLTRRTDVLQPASTALVREGFSVGAACAGLIFFILVGLLGITTLYIPNSWEYFVAARIAKNAKLIITSNADICNTYYNAFTCSELPWAYMKTSQWQVSENLNLKFYPGNVLFYSYLLIIIAFVVVLRCTHAGRLYLKRNVGGTHFTIGEIALTLFTLLMVILFFIYWAHDHNYNGYWQGGDDPLINPAERWARATGQLAVIFMSLLFFPASRNSVVHKIIGTSWEASLWAHRVLGYCMLGATFAHMTAWYKFYDIQGFFPRDMFDVPMKLPTSIDNFTVPLSTLAAWLMFLCMGFLALEPVRRRCFELFYYSHIAAAYFAIPVVLWHAAAGWEYLLPGLTVWFVDRVVRLYRGGSPVELVGTRTYRDVTELRFLKPSMHAAPGQYVFINIPEISLFEWHPFTLSTGSHSNEFTLHIKSMGSNTWTHRLLQLATAPNGAHDITIAIDGPYGSPFVASDFRKVILIAGGIGITPCASIFSYLKDDSSISSTLLWSLREEEVAAAFASHLATKSRTSGNAVNGSLPQPGLSNAKVFFTRHSSGDAAASILSELSGVEVLLSRPRFSEELLAAAAGYEPSEVVVFVCGPEPMVNDALAVASQNGFHFHRETFLL